MSMPFDLAQYLALSLTALLSAGWIGRRWHTTAGDEQTPLFCALLGLVLAAGAGLSGLAQLGLGFDTGEARIWLEQATFQLGVPLLATACLALARGWNWGRPVWGRVVLGLCVFFELARQFGWSQPYALGLGVASALVVAYAGLLHRPLGLPGAAGLLAGLLLLAGVPLPTSALTGWRVLTLACALPLLAVLLSVLSTSAQAAKPSQA